MRQEYFDIVDKNDKIIGKASRKQCHSHPDHIHRGVFVVVVDEKGRLLIQKRSMKKDIKPGTWEFPAGHNDISESYEKAAKRELKEETGITANVKKIGKIKADYGYETEFDEIFVANVRSGVKTKLDKNEVSETRWIAITDLKKELKADRKKFSDGFSMALKEYLKYCKK